MKIERIHFDEVFDVAAWRGDFSFRSGGKPHYGVHIDNKVIPRAGSTYAIAFGRPGDWTSVLAWRDLSSSAVGLKSPSWWMTLVAMFDVYYLAPAVIVPALLLGGPVAGGVAAACVGGAMLAWIAHAMLRNRRLKRLLGAMMAAGQDTEGKAGNDMGGSPATAGLPPI
ncbi:hypothetical protein [Massilia sp. ST3]|uniref:hypothetical protein n=1 Tax=Massilia sp. ST3 TaxID=2824903 RepID=UPI001B8287BE|nr:hypothetical protein [Massilia sp. ST3]MBQ5949092.1 hypothetical protein [Massilia sp. ST3]